VNLVGFIIRICHDARSPERQIQIGFCIHLMMNRVIQTCNFVPIKYSLLSDNLLL